MVEDIGTQFNINAYSDEADIKTTLIEGSARVILGKLKGGTSTSLKPGQQSIVNGQNLRTKQVNTTNYIAWKEGQFAFKNEELQSIMRKVARWYSVDVVYENQELTTRTFSGKVSRFDNVSKVLKVLQLTEDVNFKIEGRKITVF